MIRNVWIPSIILIRILKQEITFIDNLRKIHAQKFLILLVEETIPSYFYHNYVL